MRKFLVYIIILMLNLPIGCHGIRKKFVRKKRHEKESPVYVNFKEYSSKSSQKEYINYYLFVRGWLDDLTEALKRGISYKRQKRAVNEAIMNLEQMITFYDIEGKNKIYSFYEELQNIRSVIQKAPNMSEVKRNSLVRKVERLKRRFEKEFNYIDAEKWMS